MADVDYEHQLGRRCCVPKCGRLIHDLSPVEVCDSCGMKIARVFEINLQDENRARDSRATEKRDERRGIIKDSMVYYVRIHDYIKIGYSAHLRERIMGLRVDLDALLAIEPGGQQLEHQRHVQFRADRIGKREDFHPSEALQAHIASLSELYPLPPWATLPSRMRVMRRRVS